MGFFEKLKQGLSKTKENVVKQMDNLFKSFVKIDEDFLEELEELLILGDVGASVAFSMIDELRQKIKDEKLEESEQVKQALIQILIDNIGCEDNSLKLETKPSTVLVIGVNGVGKTTSIAKIAHYLKQSGKKVQLAAADTFRAAAIEQLEVWAERAGVGLIKQNEGSDPAAVVYDAISSVKHNNTDVLVVDTAGRLHNKKNLMDELNKITRVIDRELPDCSREILLVLDATTGQNAIIQAKEFKNIADITGIVLTKLDGTAKGGMVFSIKNELGIPVKYIGVGEKMEDLQPFDAEEFVKALFD
ncbi:MAG: signal recognition particle-docking protein FtsY [Clostridia bacterium]|nr:signal recognition particle-docking protein FtsY [Clostridia bacterium]